MTKYLFVFFSLLSGISNVHADDYWETECQNSVDMVHKASEQLGRIELEIELVLNGSLKRNFDELLKIREFRSRWVTVSKFEATVKCKKAGKWEER